MNQEIIKDTTTPHVFANVQFGELSTHVKVIVTPDECKSSTSIGISGISSAKENPSNADKLVVAAISSAMNNTYGKGINPEKVQELYKEVQFLYGKLKKMHKDLSITVAFLEKIPDHVMNDDTVNSLFELYKIENDMTSTEKLIEEATIF